MGDLDKLSWPVSRLGEALEALARPLLKNGYGHYLMQVAATQVF